MLHGNGRVLPDCFRLDDVKRNRLCSGIAYILVILNHGPLWVVGFLDQHNDRNLKVTLLLLAVQCKNTLKVKGKNPPVWGANLLAPPS